MLQIDPTARISPLADIEPSQRGTDVSIGPGCMIDAFVKIKPAGGSGNLVLGANSYINSGCVLYTGNGISIGSDVLVAANCTFAPVNHAFADRNKPIRLQGFMPTKGGIVIEDDCWIGANSVVLDGAHIGKGCIVAAGSVIRGKLEPFGIYGGNPLSRIGTRGP
ncbi:MAG: acyltransferase [Bosea sp. (in: a-proteobacteria)]